MVRMNRLMIIAFLSISAVWAGAVTKTVPQITIKVLSAHTESTPLSGGDNNGVPQNCGTMDYDAYCHHSRSAIVRHFMTVEDSNGKSYTVACTVDSIWSKCASLPEGAVFSAQQIKRGITVWFPNAKGKLVKQTYVLVPAGTQSAKPPSPQEEAATSSQGDDGEKPIPATSVPGDRVKCNFTSTPSGAEILLAGKYFGNTPSTIIVTSGSHSVVLSMPGFAEWKRELTVTAGSDVDVNAALQKR